MVLPSIREKQMNSGYILEVFLRELAEGLPHLLGVVWLPKLFPFCFQILKTI